MKALKIIFILVIFNIYQAHGFGLYNATNVKLGNGTVQADSIQSREHNILGIEQIIGLHKSNYLFGVNYSQVQFSQKSNIKDETNFSGIQQQGGVTLGVVSQNFGLFYQHYFISEFERSLEDSNQNNITYSKVKTPSFAIQFLYNIPFGGHIGIEYNNITYTYMSNNDYSEKISQEDQLNASNLVLLLGVNY